VSCLVRELDHRRPNEGRQQFKGKYALKNCSTSLFERLKVKMHLTLIESAKYWKNIKN